MTVMNLPSRAGIFPIPVLLAALVAVLSAAPVSGRTWTVSADGPGAAPTIQAGIDSAAVGDTVLVGPGTYYENITFRTKDLVVRSEMGPEATIIQGSPSAVTVTSVREPMSLGEDAAGGMLWLSPESLIGTVVTIEGGQSRNAVLDGFTVTGGQHGIVAGNSSPTIRGNVITGNYTNASGGGVLWASGAGAPSPLVKDNAIHDNYAYVVGGGSLVFLCRR